MIVTNNQTLMQAIIKNLHMQIHNYRLMQAEQCRNQYIRRLRSERKSLLREADDLAGRNWRLAVRDRKAA